jgi:two-component system, NtrC family, response regulator AtoC
MRIIVLVEEHTESRTRLASLLREQGYQVEEAASGRAALAAARRGRPHAMLVDLRLPDMDGLSVVETVLDQHPGLPVIAMSGSATVDAAVEAMKRGARDFAPMPVDLDALLSSLDRYIGQARDAGAVPAPASELMAQMEACGLIAQSRSMMSLFEMTKHVAPHSATVLLLGESGSGKELFARALHTLGARAPGPFVPINCATLSEPMLENELFGHEKGAFTSADKPKEGVMETAHHGTLFLDEINEIGLGCQAKLLRAIERRQFRRVGGTQKISVDVNLVAACNVDLEACVERGTFRSDLYYRLKVITLTVPPLREHPEDIDLLAPRFLADIARHAGLPTKRLSTEALHRLRQYAWPGNVRELRNCMESLTLMVSKPIIDVEDLPLSLRGCDDGEIRLRVGMRLDDIEREVIRRTLDVSATVKDAARVLGISLRTLHERMGRYGLRRSRAATRA